MRKLALEMKFLLSIEKPARYIGNEVNAVMKSRGRGHPLLPCASRCLCSVTFGIQILYDMFNKREDT